MYKFFVYLIAVGILFIGVSLFADTVKETTRENINGQLKETTIVTTVNYYDYSDVLEKRKDAIAKKVRAEQKKLRYRDAYNVTSINVDKELADYDGYIANVTK